MHLADTLAGDAEFFADFLECLELLAIETETGIDDAALAFIQDIEEIADLVTEVFVAKGLIGVHRLIVTDDVAECGRILVVDRLIQRSRADGCTFKRSDLRCAHADFLGEFLIGGLAAEFLGHLVGNTAELGDLVHEVDGESDRFALICEGAFDRLLDPPRRIGAEFAAFFGVKALHSLHEADVTLGDEIEEREAKIAVVARDFHHEAEV